MHSQDEFKQVLINAPIPVNFAGLRGTTMSMQADGWQLNVETYCRADLHFSYEVRLVGKHPDLRLYFYSGVCLFDGREMMQSRDYVFDSAIHMEFPICAEHMTKNIMVSRAPDVRAYPVDFSKPFMAKVPMNDMFNLEDLFIFKPMNTEVEIYLPEKEIWTVQKHLDKVLDLQAEKQAEIREKKRKERRHMNNGQEIKPGEQVAKNEVKLQLVAI